MVARVWRGWTTIADADPYDEFLRTKLFPRMSAELSGFRGGHVLRREEAGETEFLVVTVFDSLDDIRRFAGDDLELAVIEPEAERLLARAESRATHYDLRAPL